MPGKRASATLRNPQGFPVLFRNPVTGYLSGFFTLMLVYQNAVLISILGVNVTVCVGWLGWLVCACVHEFRSPVRSFVRSLALDIAFALDLTLAPDLAHMWLRHRTAGCSSVKVHGSKLGTFQRWPKASLATARYPLRKRTSPCGAFARLRTRSPPACGASLPRGMLSS